MEYRDMIRRQMLKDEPEKLFVFADNMIGMGFGGQAFEMRGEPNAVGIITKRYPSMKPGSFLTNDDAVQWAKDVRAPMIKLGAHILDDGVVVWPRHGIGTGRANLFESSPVIWSVLESMRMKLDRMGDADESARMWRA